MRKDYTELVNKARDGNEDALRQLTERIHAPLHSYVCRITLIDDLVDDVVQETIVEMYKILGELKNADQFWPWLCKIALNKIRGHSRKENLQKRLLHAHAEQLVNHSANLEGLTNLINEEIKEAIILAMSQLTDEQKAVLSMRCYENLPYSQISEITGFSELKSRLLFLRGKRKLQKTLFRFGLTKKALLPALVIFGKLTAPTEAAATHITVTSGSLSVGALATVIGTVSTKTVLSITAGAAITTGAVMGVNQLSNDTDPYAQNDPQSSIIIEANSDRTPTDILEGYYYYPTGSNGPMMTRLTLLNPNNKQPCKILQNNTGNFFHSGRTGQVEHNNYHYWNRDLSVMVLPTDRPDFLSFLAQVEGQARSIQTLHGQTDQSLLVVASKQDNANTVSVAIQNYDALMEERFQYNWPEDTRIEDNRDSIHQQGWCYVDITGSIHGQRVDGQGQIPFIYNTSVSKPAWLRMSIGYDEIIDTSSGAVYINHHTGSKTLYKPGSFIQVLNQPWAGLHCIDTVRRAAVQKRIAFDTAYDSDPSKCIVQLIHDTGSLEYLINMQQDWIETITFHDLNHLTIGTIYFDYVNPEQVQHSNYIMPGIPRCNGKDILRNHWLIELANDWRAGKDR